MIFFGLSVGSFLNVVIARFDALESVFKTRSHCPKCKKQIPWYDLVPFFSWVLLAGKCRQCKKTISLQYPLVEVATAIVFALIYWKFGFSIDSLFLILISSLLIIIGAYDILHLEIPDILIYLAAVLALGLILSHNLASTDLNNWLSELYGVLAGFGFFAFLVLVSRQKWMGAGDALLGGLIGLILGWPQVLVALFLAFILGSLVSIVLMILKQKKMKDVVPFGPFLVAATFIAIFWGEKLIEMYFLRFGI